MQILDETATATAGATQRRSTRQRQQAILEAALSLFASKGFAGTSIEEICTTSGASIGSLYHHFGSKEGLAAALYAHAIADYQRGAIAVFRDARTAGDGIRGCVEQFLTWVEDNRELASLMLAVEHSEIRELAAERVADLNAGFVPVVRAWVTERVNSGQLPALPDDLLLAAVLGPARRFADLWLEGRTTTPIAEAARAFAELTWAGLGRPLRHRADDGAERAR